MACHMDTIEPCNLARNDPAAFKSIKWLLRKPIAEKQTAGEESSIREFVDIWYPFAG